MTDQQRDQQHNPYEGGSGPSEPEGGNAILIVSIVLAVCFLGAVGFMVMGKSVQSQVGASTQKMVGSISHDAKLEDYGADARVGAEKIRDNLMTHEGGSYSSYSSSHQAEAQKFTSYETSNSKPQATPRPTPRPEPKKEVAQFSPPAASAPAPAVPAISVPAERRQLASAASSIAPGVAGKPAADNNSSGRAREATMDMAASVPSRQPVPEPEVIEIPVSEEAPDAMFFEHAGVNPFTDTEDDALSTFAIDVDTASYTVARKYLLDGHLPEPASVRVEEFVNYFKQDYQAPVSKAFAVHMEGAPSPFGDGNPKRLLLKVGVQGRVIGKDDRRDAGLVFVVDISGSMRQQGRYRTVQDALNILVDQLRPTDMVGIVAYDTRAEIRLPPTLASNKQRILDAIATLQPRGSTNVEQGLIQGYQMAAHMLDADKTTRVILMADGVANTGLTNPDALVGRVKGFVKDGVAMTAIGVGLGNYNDALMEKIANAADGNYFYVDTVQEARRVFDENLVSTLENIAKDVKIQVEFNPDTVGRYRLLGYENRDVADSDFRNDSVDAGEVGAGASVTALYEIIVNDVSPGASWQFATARVRWADPDTGDVEEIEKDFTRHELTDEFRDTSPRFKMSASVARLAEILRESPWTREATLAETVALARELANGPLAEDPDVVEFAFLAAQAEKLWVKKHGRRR